MLAPYPNNILIGICLDTGNKDITAYLDFDVGTYELTEKKYNYFRFFELDSAEKLEVKSLRFVDGSYKSLEILPPSVSKMSTVSILQLEGNKLTKIPRAIFRNRNLKLLDLRYNPIDKKRLEKYRKRRKDLILIW